MKRILTIVLILMLTLSLTACGVLNGNRNSIVTSNDTPSDNNNTSSNTQDNSTPTSSESSNTSPTDGGSTNGNGTGPLLQSDFTLVRFEVTPPNYILSFYLYLDEHQMVSGYDTINSNAKTLNFSDAAGVAVELALDILLPQMFDKGFIQDGSEIGMIVLTEDNDEAAIETFFGKLSSQIYSFADLKNIALYTYAGGTYTGDQVRFDIGLTGSSADWPSNEIVNLFPMPDRNFSITEANHNGPGYFLTVSLNREEPAWIVNYLELIKANGFTLNEGSYTDSYYSADNSSGYTVIVRDGDLSVGVSIFKGEG